LVSDIDVTGPELLVESGGSGDFRKIADHGFSKRRGGQRAVKVVGSDVETKGNSIDPVGLFMEAVIVQFALNIEQNQKTTGDSDSQTGDIDEGIGAVPSDDPHDHRKIVFDHSLFSCQYDYSAAIIMPFLFSGELKRFRLHMGFHMFVLEQKTCAGEQSSFSTLYRIIRILFI